MLAASSQPPGTDIGVDVLPQLVSLRGQLSMVAYRQPVLLDVNVFDKDAVVGAAVGARVSPELVGGGVGASVGVGVAQFLMKTRQYPHAAERA